MVAQRDDRDSPTSVGRGIGVRQVVRDRIHFSLCLHDRDSWPQPRDYVEFAPFAARGRK